MKSEVKSQIDRRDLYIRLENKVHLLQVEQKNRIINIQQLEATCYCLHTLLCNISSNNISWTRAKDLKIQNYRKSQIWEEQKYEY